MKEYVRCALTGYHTASGPERKTWCGRRPDASEFTFVDASHAAINARNGGYTLTCEACAKAIAATLLDHTGKR